MHLSGKDKTLYSTWARMKQRCNGTSNAKDAPNYHERGITYDPRWESFDNFFQDMKAGWRKGLTLDRTNNDGNYSKGNCRWVSRKIQAINRRNTQFVPFNGITKTLTDWAEELGFKRSTLAQRFYVYKWSAARTLTTPIR